MKILSLIISFFVTVGVIFMAITNNFAIISFNAAGNRVTLHLGILLIIIFLCGILVGAVLVGQKYFSQKNTISDYKRKIEKDSVLNNENTSKVAVLEAKIKTLEKALDDALKNK